ncbi:EpsG family protein [Paenibacillus sp. IITD108]|uniref:EpsG family protein n=1 Tax=Paenibacillus sp. IITD108 TaxID=3116649 RepID=UPI002F4118B1
MALILVIPNLILQENLIKSNMKINTQKSGNNILIYYVLIVFVIIIGLRDTASISLDHFRQSDELNYRNAFNLLIGSTFSLANITSYEWARYLLDWSLANLFKHSQVWVFIYALITNYVFIKAINKYVQPFWFGVFLYITVGLFTFQMNGTTSVLAGAIILKSIDYLIERKFLKYLFVIFLAAGIHFSAWIMVPLFFVLNKRSFSKGIIVWVLLSLFFLFNFQNIANFLLPKTPYAYYLYQINSVNSYGVNIWRTIIFVCIYLFIILKFKKIKDKVELDYIFINMIVVLILINIISIAYVYLYRFNELFIFSLIYMLPRVLNHFNGSIRILLYAIFTIAFIIFGLQQNWNALYENILLR